MTYHSFRKLSELPEPIALFFFNALIPHLDEIENHKDTSEQYFIVLEKVLKAAGTEGLDLAGLLEKLAGKINSLPVVETGTDGTYSDFFKF